MNQVWFVVFQIPGEDSLENQDGWNGSSGKGMLGYYVKRIIKDSVTSPSLSIASFILPLFLLIYPCINKCGL